MLVNFKLFHRLCGQIQCKRKLARLLVIILILAMCCPWTQCNAQCNGSAPAAQPVTIDDETVQIPQSRQLINGINTTVDTSVPGQVKIDLNNYTSPATTTGVTVLPTPMAPSVSTVGTAGSTTYQYVVVAKDANGDACPFQLAAGTALGNATLSSTNYNVVSWTAVTGATSYDVYRIASSLSTPVVGKLANTISTSFNDQSNLVGDGSLPPALPTTTLILTTASNPEQQLDCTLGNIVVVLPDATTCAGSQFTFKRLDSTKNTANIIAYGAQIVAQNLSTWTLFNKANPLSIFSDGSSNWRNLTNPLGDAWTVAALPSKRSRGCTDWNTNNMVVQGTDGKLYGWGLTTNENIADGNTSPSGLVSLNHPVAFDPNNPPATGTYIVDWAASANNLFVVLSDGTVYGAGQNADGQLGVGTVTACNYLQKIPYFSTNGITIEKVWTFGWGSYAGTHGKTFFCSNTGVLYACGYNTTYDLGFSTNTAVQTPQAVTNTSIPIYNPVQIRSAHTYTGGDFTLLCDATGALWVTGYNSNGQLGNNGTATQMGFSKISASTFIAPIINVYPYGADASANEGFGAVLDANGVLYMAGVNAYGQLGHGNTAASTTWNQVASTQENLSPSSATYITGTVSITSGASTVSGSATSWSTTTLPAPATAYQIGFGSTNPGAISTWYPISAIGGLTSITLGSAYTGATLSASPYVIMLSRRMNYPIVDFAWTGNGNGMGCVALDKLGAMWTWGYNGTNSLFYGNTTTQYSPSANVNHAKVIGATNTTTVAVTQNTVVWDGIALRIAGTTLDGFINIPDLTYAGAVDVPLPQSITSGAESISDLFVNNNSTAARVFVLTDHGNLYSSGDNANAVTTGGISGPASVGLYKIGN